MVDSRHNDLLPDWEAVDNAVDKIFNPAFRASYKDSYQRMVAFSWFFISWSGFKTNPVQRDFGYFNIFDHYNQRWSNEMKKYNDQLFWMYNHPAESGIGNEWGLDWLHNSHYLQILMRFVAERQYFPSVVEIVTEKNDTSHFLENYFPFDLSNRNSVDVNWNAINADGKPMSDVIDWRRAPHDWEIYSPSELDYQRPGSMKRKIGRLLDIKSVVYELKDYEIEKAFQTCLEGKNAMICAYEHDFRDRYQTIVDKLLDPVVRISKKYPEIKWRYANVLEAFQNLSNDSNDSNDIKLNFNIKLDANGNLLIHSNGSIFGRFPFAFLKNGDDYIHLTPLPVGENVWLLDKGILIPGYQLFVAACTANGCIGINTFDVSF
ncbi:hypothetical protein [Legionella bononiensis]|uniref:hypothetical protein n=1 Tax=Legionella bononiensis TaxID=2793102 RepID=UPI0019325630|nr:hypothetical protein [Legionella bononiensis]MBL7561640.1 hypothetical protein [Legionella bononiensis]